MNYAHNCASITPKLNHTLYIYVCAYEAKCQIIKGLQYILWYYMHNLCKVNQPQLLDHQQSRVDLGQLIQAFLS